jgi:drug/metabolite transporter (DMT)-like permease
VAEVTRSVRRERTVLGPEPTAALLMMTAAACFVGMTSTVKLLSAELATPQIVWGRYAFHLVIVLVLLRGRLGGVIATARPEVQVARSLLMFAATSLSFLALRWLPLAEVAAIMFLTPVLVTALAAAVLGEPVGIRRWAAVATGFAGALVIIRPGLGAVHPAAFAAVLCAASYASYQITTRVVGDSAPPVVSLFYSCLVGVLASSLILPFVWRTPEAAGWVLLALSGTFGALGHLAMIAALARAPASVVTPFTYTQLIWATVAGFVLFGELPDLYTYVGAALIAGSGLYVMHRERVRRRGAAAASVADRTPVTPGARRSRRGRGREPPARRVR